MTSNQMVADSPAVVDDSSLRGKLSRLLQRKNRGRYLLSRLLLKTRLCRFITFKVHGYRMRFYPTDLSSHFWYKRESRGRDIRFIRGYLKSGETYIDAGANIGGTVIAGALSVGDTGRVLAFEPHPDIFRYMMGNVHLNNLGNVKGINVALGRERGTTSFTNLDCDDRNHVDSSGNGRFPIPVEKLDSITSDLPGISLIKVDVEGFEAELLRGASAALKKAVTLYIEISEEDLHRYGASGAEVFRVLRGAGFRIFRWRDPRTLVESNEASPTFSGHENIVATKQPRELETRLSEQFRVVSGSA